jgi:hypothetical protein
MTISGKLCLAMQLPPSCYISVCERRKFYQFQQKRRFILLSFALAVCTVKCERRVGRRRPNNSITLQRSIYCLPNSSLACLLACLPVKTIQRKPTKSRHQIAVRRRRHEALLDPYGKGKPRRKAALFVARQRFIRSFASPRPPARRRASYVSVCVRVEQFQAENAAFLFRVR